MGYRLVPPTRPLDREPRTKLVCDVGAALHQGLGAFWAKALLRKLANPANQLYEFGALFWTSPKPRIWQPNTCGPPGAPQSLLQRRSARIPASGIITSEPSTSSQLASSPVATIHEEPSSTVPPNLRT
ncbi:hypothetical protein PIB30_051344 [Stylosanthes scabra]|uniref:Uncharacterized protein n=1 Tax=Stylosanthes scabra TaxID=79078 RepID=A0ABU6XJG9_9FABA|nr:hypothetical protein [Stylosanthes scabra]